jgi:hypothetical protein
MPHYVDCRGLAREDLGDEHFRREIHLRLTWLRDNCAGKFEPTPIRKRATNTHGPLVGLRFWFESQTEAAAFKLRFY